MFSPAVTGYWFRGVDPASAPASPDELVLVVDAGLPDNRRLSVLRPVGAGGFAFATPEVAQLLGLTAGTVLDDDGLATAVMRSGLTLNGADAVFHHPEPELAVLRSAVPPPNVRLLVPDDDAAFAAFEAAAPEGDLEEAFVEIDHWAAVGAFDGGRLVGVASAYPWDGSTLADLGVITLPEVRGRGVGRALVRALAVEILARGHELQYRCQLDNHASIALAGSAGLRRFATWDVVAPE